MAKQNGLVKLIGSVGDMTYYKSIDGFLAKEKATLTRERIATDPKFRRTRENMAEFGNAGKSGKTFRESMQLLLQNAKDSKLSSRMCKSMMQVLKSDTTNRRGKRKVASGDATLLNGFEFNIHAVLSTTLFAPYTPHINRQSGTLSVTIPAFIPETDVILPVGATHFQFVSAGAAVDFDNQIFESTTSESDVLPWDENTTTALTLTNTVTAASTLPLFLAFGITFYQEVNGFQYPFAGSTFNALSIIQVDKV